MVIVNAPIPICCDNNGFEVLKKDAIPTPTPLLMPYRKLSRKHGIVDKSRPKSTRPCKEKIKIIND